MALEILRRRRAVLASTAAVAVLGATAISGPAAAGPFIQESDSVSVSGSIQVIDSGTTATGGWVEFTGEGTVTVDMREASTGGASAQGLTTKKVGGGTWTYGTGVSVVGEKTCTSKYFHASRDHTSTVRMGPRVKRSTTWSGNWSNAKVQGWTTATCRAYWNNL